MLLKAWLDDKITKSFLKVEYPFNGGGGLPFLIVAFLFDCLEFRYDGRDLVWKINTEEKSIHEDVMW